MHFPICTFQFVLSNLHFPIYTFQFALSNFQFSICTFQFALSQFAICNLHFPICTFQFPIFNLQFSICTFKYRIRCCVPLIPLIPNFKYYNSSWRHVRHASMDASPVQAAHAYRAWLSSKKLISRGGGSE